MFLVARIPVFLKNSVCLTSLILFLYAGFVFSSDNAAAAERAHEVTERIVTLLKSHGAGEVTYTSASYDAAQDAVIITGFQAAGPPGEDSLITADLLVLSGAQTPDDGTLIVDSIVMTGGVATGEKDKKLIIGQLTGLEIFIPTKAMTEVEGESVAYTMAREVVLEDVVFGDKPSIPVELIQYSRGVLDGNLPVSMTLSFDGLEVNVDEIDDKKGQETLRELGYDTLDINGSLVWLWDSAGEESVVGPVVFTVSDAGGYEFRTELGGITQELLMATEPGEAMQYVQQVTLNSFELVYNDDSAIDRVIAYTEREADLDRNAVIAVWVSMVRDGLEQVQTPQNFNDMVLSAVQTFLDDPQSLTISMNPAPPLPISQIMGSFMFGPAAIIPLLNISVSAN